MEVRNEFSVSYRNGRYVIKTFCFIIIALALILIDSSSSCTCDGSDFGSSSSSRNVFIEKGGIIYSHSIKFALLMNGPDLMNKLIVRSLFHLF